MLSTAVTKPHFSSYPPSTYDLHQEPEPSEEEQLVEMLKDWFKKQDEKLDAMAEIFQSQNKDQATTLQIITDQTRQLTENQSYIPQEAFSDDTDEAFEYQAFHDDTLSDEKAEQY